MICCLNPDCPNPQNSKGIRYCQSCGTQLIPLLRGRYGIAKLLSDEGGFGRTYLAEDVDKLNEHCVVKQLAPKVQGTWALNKAKQLFEEEAKRLQELGKHPQIPTLLAYFEQDNNLYLVQEFIDGQNLLKELEVRLTYSEREIRELLLDLLPILNFIHERGVIHRDIKPQNIMQRSPQLPLKRGTNSPLTSGSGEDLVLIDFGASKQLTATVQTKPGTTIGSHGYSPVEQIKGGEAYPASDLFSVGATCFHLLTGISPFQLWVDHGYGWVADWRQYLRIPVSSELGEVLDKLLKKDIQERYQSAAQVISDLTLQPPTLRVSPTQPVPQQITQPPPRPPVQNLKLSMPIGLFIFAAVVVGGVVLGYQLHHQGWLSRMKAPVTASPNPQPSVTPTKSATQVAQGEVIETNAEITLNRMTPLPETEAIAPLGSVLQIIPHKKEPAKSIFQDNWVYLRVCSIGQRTTSPTSIPLLKAGDEARMDSSSFKKLKKELKFSPSKGDNASKCQPPSKESTVQSTPKPTQNGEVLPKSNTTQTGYDSQ